MSGLEIEFAMDVPETQNAQNLENANGGVDNDAPTTADSRMPPGTARGLSLPVVRQR